MEAISATQRRCRFDVSVWWAFAWLRADNHLPPFIERYLAAGKKAENANSGGASKPPESQRLGASCAV